jgi:hypothetical protein
MKQAFNTDELTEGLRALGGDGFTTREFKHRFNCGDDKARKEIRRLIEAGIVRPARLPRISMADVRQIVRGYRLVEGGE